MYRFALNRLVRRSPRFPFTLIARLATLLMLLASIAARAQWEMTWETDGASGTQSGSTTLAVHGTGEYMLKLPSEPVHGKTVCPLFEKAPVYGGVPKLNVGCTTMNVKPQKAAFLGAKTAECPQGFRDPRNGGECWSCPSGYTRTAFYPVDSAQACWKAISEELSRAARVSVTTCPSGQFFDPRNGGECWSCPSGYYRTWDAVTWSTACAKGIFGPFSHASFHMAMTSGCPSGTFWDPIRGGECWSCPSGYRRTLNHVESDAACAKTIPTQYVGASFLGKSGCGTFDLPPGFGPAFHDPRNGGECWACPAWLERTVVYPVDTASACFVKQPDEALIWDSPQFPEPGLFALIKASGAGDNLARRALANPWRVDAFLLRQAKGDAAKARERWLQMIRNPADSAELKALIYLEVVGAAALGTASNEIKSDITVFEEYMRRRRMFIAQDASDMYGAWLPIDAYVQAKSLRLSNGGVPEFSGGTMSTGVLGAIVPDFTAVAWRTAYPDPRAQATLDAIASLGGAEVRNSTLLIEGESGQGFSEDVVLPLLWKGIDIGLDQYAGWVAENLVEFMGVSGQAFQTIGRGAFIGVLGVQAGLDMFEAITILNSKEEAQKSFTNALVQAQQYVTLKSLIDGDRAAESMLFWALATAPYKGGPKMWDGALASAQLCSQSEQSGDCRELRILVANAAHDAGQKEIYQSAVTEALVTDRRAAGDAKPLSFAWQQVSGGANDISLDGDGLPWLIGGNAMGGNNYDLWRFDLAKNNWSGLPGAAMRIGADGEGAWVVNGGGQIYRWAGTGWQYVPGPKAVDIGAGGGKVWILAEPVSGPSYTIYWWENGNWQRVGGSAAANRIDVDSQGNPWMVNAGGQVWALENGNWRTLPSDPAVDIAIGPPGEPWIVTKTGALKSYDATAKRWTTEVPSGVAAVAISASGLSSMPWYLGTNNAIYEAR